MRPPLTPDEEQAIRARKALRRKMREEKRRQVCELRLQGLSWEQIGRAMGFKNKSTAYRIFEDAMAAIPKSKADSLRKLQEARLDKLLRASYRIIDGVKQEMFRGSPRPVTDPFGEQVPIHDVKTRLAAMAEVRAVVADLNKLFGLNAPIKHRHGGDPGAPPVQMGLLDYATIAGLSDDDLNEAVERATAALGRVTAASATPDLAAGAGEEATGSKTPDGGSG